MWTMIRRQYSPGFYWACVHLLRFLLVSLTRWKVEGRERVPDSGAVILACNHLSNADPPILAAAALKRHVRFMAKAEVFRVPLLGVGAKWWGAFPVRRLEADMAALMNAQRSLDRGEILGMFPEGTRSRTGKLRPARGGTALIALRSGVPVIPCTLTGTERLRSPLFLVQRPRIKARFGEPIVVEQVKKPTEQQIDELTQRIMMEIAALLPPEYLDTYTGDEVKQVANGQNTPSK